MESIEGRDKVIVRSKLQETNGLVVGIKSTSYGKDYFIEPRGVFFQPLKNKSGIIRVTSIDIENGEIEIKIHRKHNKKEQ